MGCYYPYSFNGVLKASSHPNLLVLNASIEASRAAGASRGFIVAADELSI